MIKIVGADKSKTHSVYVLKKEQEFFSGFRKFLSDMDFGNEDSSPDIYGFGRPVDKEGEYILSKEDKIYDYVDDRTSFFNEDLSIDVIFGKNRIFLIFSSKEDYQQKINKNLIKFCSF